MKDIKLELLRQKLNKKWNTDRHIPFTIVRTSDDARLLLNNDYETYSFEPIIGVEYTASPNRYTYERLMYDERNNNGEFIVEGWAPIDNLINKPDTYFTEKFQKIELNERR